MAFSQSDYEKMIARVSGGGRAANCTSEAGEQKQKKYTRKKASDTKGIQHIKTVLKEYNFACTEENRFTELRRFRFDLAVVDLKLAIEYEGLMSGKSRHTTVTGFTQDTDKYNLAQAKGWTVLRYTTLNYKNFELDLLRWLFRRSSIPPCE